MGVEIQTITPGDAYKPLPPGSMCVLDPGATFPKKGQTVSLHYTGCLTDGKVFDSSREHGIPLSFRIGHGEVIKGWDDGVSQMSLGQRAKLICTPDYAYGKKGYPGVIPPDATLVFDVELVRIV